MCSLIGNWRYLSLFGTDALAASPSFPVACAIFSPHRTLIMSHLHGAFCFYLKKKKKKLPCSCVVVFHVCVMIRDSSGASVLQGAPSCVVRQNDLVETQRGGMWWRKSDEQFFFFSPSFPLWWCFAVFRGNAFSPRGGTPCPLTLEWGGRGMLEDDPGFSGLLGAFTTCLHVWCLCPCGSHDCSSGSFWAVNGIQPRGEGKGVAAAGRREQLLLQTCRTTDILLWCDLWVVIGSLTRSRPLN